MRRPAPEPLPSFTPDRLLERIAEAMQAGINPASLRQFPAWTQRVMHILKEQFVPREFASVLAADHAIFAEGVAVAWAALARNITQSQAHHDGSFARKLAERLALDGSSQQVAAEIESGTFAATEELQQQIMQRLFAPDLAERRAFAEGLAMGNRLPELLDRQVERGTTDATAIYLILWFYWPEISRLRSIGEVAQVLQPFFAANKNLAGAHWDERIRKLANRIGLSFRGVQARKRIGTKETAHG